MPRHRLGLCRSAAPTRFLAFLAVLAPPAALANLPQRESLVTPMVVLGYNDLGMHCMNSDFSELLILPPYNTLHAQVIRRGREPDVVTGGVTVRYFIPRNTHAADKSNFWEFQTALLGTNLPANVGLAGARLRGNMTVNPSGDWSVTGIPIVPSDDTGRENPYPLATIEVRSGSTLMARTQAVVPVSTEMSCHLCHNRPGVSVATDILARHDELHQTNLLSQRPVLCAGCHADNALGLPGQPGVPNLSAAMHGAHADRMGSIGIPESCYACHPGVRTQCQRDVHFANDIHCTACHGDMVAMGNPARRPWIDEPRCGTCHTRPEFQFEEPGKLFRDSVGHGGVHCSACHGSPHAITPTITAVDNAQAMQLQGHAGTIDTCTVCHDPGPPDVFEHHRPD